MRNSMSSDVCTLYDKTALINLIDMKAPHPLSRETITASMIIGKDECYFVPDRESFILKES
ncbi:T3SS effector NleG family protein [Escherichia albertii]|nr:T3SS effector NleG family protein [Escherichia albertii]